MHKIFRGRLESSEYQQLRKMLISCAFFMCKLTINDVHNAIDVAFIYLIKSKIAAKKLTLYMLFDSYHLTYK